uniref:Beta-2-glycoprotein 1 n=1 Tax=Gouania willdenowi TaxID=441366 RepID=A0A8C5D460_GOUWI
MELVLTLLLCSLEFFITVSSNDNPKVCPLPEVSSNVEIGSLRRTFSPGEELFLSCMDGYTPVSGLPKIVCGSSGEWTKSTLTCMRRRCPQPRLSNGNFHSRDYLYQSTINYTCDEGYKMTGSSTAVCQADGTWSSPTPICTIVTCGLAPIPLFAMVTYNKRFRGNTTNFGDTATYKCLPPYALIGYPTAECTVNGSWTQTPKCQVVTCPPPENIENGIMYPIEKRNFGYMETVKFSCMGNYVLEGNVNIFCQKDGNWSIKPTCMAPCTVDIQRGRISFQGEKIWIEHFKPNLVYHKGQILLYCKNKERNCGYTVPAQCFNGSLSFPECFKGKAH